MNGKRSITLSVLLAALLLVSGAWLHWRLASVRHQRLDALTTSIRTAERWLAEDPIPAEFVLLRARDAAFEEAVPMRTEVADVLVAVSRDLNELGVADRAVTTGSASLHDDIQQMPLSLTFQGC